MQYCFLLIGTKSRDPSKEISVAKSSILKIIFFTFTSPLQREEQVWSN